MASDTPNQTVPWLTWLPRFLCLALALYVASVCWQIERLNAEAGYELPRRDFDFTGSGNQKWRQSPIVSEEAWIRFRRPTNNGEPDRSPLTPQERNEMEASVKAGIAANQLREVVGEQGLAQYPLGMIASAWSFLLLRRSSSRQLRIIFAASLVLALSSLGLAFYRGYFTSLGW